MILLENQAVKLKANKPTIHQSVFEAEMRKLVQGRLLELNRISQDLRSVAPQFQESGMLSPIARQHLVTTCRNLLRLLCFALLFLIGNGTSRAEVAPVPVGAIITGELTWNGGDGWWQGFVYYSSYFFRCEEIDETGGVFNVYPAGAYFERTQFEEMYVEIPGESESYPTFESQLEWFELGGVEQTAQYVFPGTFYGCEFTHDGDMAHGLSPFNGSFVDGTHACDGVYYSEGCPEHSTWQSSSADTPCTCSVVDPCDYPTTCAEGYAWNGGRCQCEQCHEPIVGCPLGSVYNASACECVFDCPDPGTGSPGEMWDALACQYVETTCVQTELCINGASWNYATCACDFVTTEVPLPVNESPSAAENWGLYTRVVNRNILIYYNSVTTLTSGGKFHVWGSSGDAQHWQKVSDTVLTGTRVAMPNGVYFFRVTCDKPYFPMSAVTSCTVFESGMASLPAVVSRGGDYYAWGRAFPGSNTGQKVEFSGIAAPFFKGAPGTPSGILSDGPKALKYGTKNDVVGAYLSHSIPVDGKPYLMRFTPSEFASVAP